MTTTALRIEPRTDFIGTHRTGRLPPNFTEAQITRALGIFPERDLCEKVTREWNFWVDGEACAIWDYKGTCWSAFGPPELMRQIFPQYIAER